MRLSAKLAGLASSVFIAGCSTFRSSMVDSFVDDLGNVMIVEYGEMSRPYTYKIVSPMNGVELECTDRKVVRVTLPEPNGSTLWFYICQNDSPKGTMYATRDGKWKFLTIGLMCRLYLQTEDRTDYLLVFGGTNTPSIIEGGGR